jgi:diacylglycerol O-acyltransferase / wax synthase
MSSRFSSADAAWLHMDRPTNLMVINTVLLFDEPVDWNRVKQVTQERLVDSYPKFRQRVIESRLPLQAPKWEDDPDFSLEHHMHHFALPAPGDISALQELVGDLMTMPLDRARPLWHTYMIDGFGDGAAMLTRMHHCIADGISLARVMMSLADGATDAQIEEDDVGEGGGGGGSLRGIVSGASHLVTAAGSAVARQVGSIARSPTHAPRVAGAVARDASTVVRLLLTPADAATALKGEPGVSRRVAWTKPMSLPLIKEIGYTHKATVNDVLLAAVSGALRHYLQDHDSPVGEIQAMVPFNLRPLDKPLPRKLGNKFGMVFLPLPVGTSGSYRRLVEVHRRMKRIKTGRDGPVSYGLLGLTGLTPEPVERRIIDLFTAKGTAVMTNVPGPREPVYVAGTPVRAVLVWAPTSGHIGMSVSIFSYRNEVTVGLMVDAALIPDPDRIIDQLEREVNVMAELPAGRRGHARRGHARRGPRRSRAKSTTTRSKTQEHSHV